MAILTPQARVSPLERGVRVGSWAGYAGFLIMGMLIVLTALAPVIAPYPPEATSAQVVVAPNAAHIFGTDNFGRDVYSRWLFGAAPTLLAGWVSAIASAVIGTLIGILAAAGPRWLDSALMRVMDVLLAFPSLLMTLLLVAALGGGLPSIIVGITVAHIPQFARVVYGSARSVRTRSFIEVATLQGSRIGRTIVRHYVPNVLPEIVILTTSVVGWSMLSAATLNFLGFGIAAPAADWGADLRAGTDWLYVAPWMSIAPGLGITLAILSSVLMGDYLAARLGKRSGGLRRAPRGQKP